MGDVPLKWYRKSDIIIEVLCLYGFQRRGEKRKCAGWRRDREQLFLWQED